MCLCASSIACFLEGILHIQRNLNVKALATYHKDSCLHIKASVGASCHMIPQGISIPHSSGNTSAELEKRDCTASFSCDMTVIFV